MGRTLHLHTVYVLYHNIPFRISTLIVLMLPSFDLANRALSSSFAGKKIVSKSKNLHVHECSITFSRNTYVYR